MHHKQMEHESNVFPTIIHNNNINIQCFSPIWQRNEGMKNIWCVMILRWAGKLLLYLTYRAITNTLLCHRNQDWGLRGYKFRQWSNVLSFLRSSLRQGQSCLSTDLSNVRENNDGEIKNVTIRKHDDWWLVKRREGISYFQIFWLQN